jgi:hypothetical protein
MLTTPRSKRRTKARFDLNRARVGWFGRLEVSSSLSGTGARAGRLVAREKDLRARTWPGQVRHWVLILGPGSFGLGRGSTRNEVSSLEAGKLASDAGAGNVGKERDGQTPRADASTSLLSTRNGSPKPHTSTNRRQSPSDRPLERVSRVQEGRKRQFRVKNVECKGRKKNVPEGNAGMLHQGET